MLPYFYVRYLEIFKDVKYNFLCYISLVIGIYFEVF